MQPKSQPRVSFCVQEYKKITSCQKCVIKIFKYFSDFPEKSPIHHSLQVRNRQLGKTFNVQNLYKKVLENMLIFKHKCNCLEIQ